MADQLNIFGGISKPIPKVDKEKRKWENAFQKWSNERHLDGSYHYGSCGYGSMCDYCEDNTYGRPCVRALNAMCRDQKITLDYSNRNYEEIWDGDF